MDADITEAMARERRLLAAARAGDEDAFRQLVELHHNELHAHCYRMLGSAHAADDALQDALLRAWRALAKFERRSSLRWWLYRTATNACLDLISRRPKRVLPIDYGPPPTPTISERPLTESVWVEPYADEQLSVEDGYAAPEARYERREAVELAFIAALQHLPGNQRAALILRDMLGFSARESAEALDTTVASVNGAFRRSRKAVAAFLTRFPLQDRWRLLSARANGQLAFGCYAWDAERNSYTALTLDGARVNEVTSFVTPDTRGPARDRFAVDVLGRFDLPNKVD